MADGGPPKVARSDCGRLKEGKTASCPDCVAEVAADPVAVLVPKKVRTHKTAAKATEKPSCVFARFMVCLWRAPARLARRTVPTTLIYRSICRTVIAHGAAEQPARDRKSLHQNSGEVNTMTRMRKVKARGAEV
jgi:hypothetical protein